MKTIAIDIDNTISATHDFYLNLANEYDKNYLKKNNYIDETKVVPRSLDWTKEELSYFIENYFNPNTVNIPLVKNADEYIRKLKELGYKIIIITNRGLKNDDHSDEYTEQYLKKHNIPFDELIVRAKDKYIYMKEVDIFIDDSVKECEEVFKNCDCEVIMIEANTNRGYLNSKITKLNGWESIYKFIKSMNEL